MHLDSVTELLRIAQPNAFNLNTKDGKFIKKEIKSDRDLRNTVHWILAWGQENVAVHM